MKLSKIKSPILLLAIAAIFASCADLSVQNVNDPTKEAVEGNPANQTKLLAGGFYDLTTAMVSQHGVNINMIADQNTSTNNFNAYWDFTEEPRRRLTNTTSYSNTDVFEDFFEGANSAVATANLFINNIVNEGQTVTNDNGDDITNDILAQAYFLRGLSYGFLGLMYDQGYLIDENFNTETDEPSFVPYGQLIDASIADLREAISLAAGSSTFTFNAMPNPVDSWNAQEFQDIVNSYAARIMAGEARTAEERDGLDWQTILDFAQKGIGGPQSLSDLGVFSNQNIGSSGEFANYLTDWSNFLVAGSLFPPGQGNGYNPTDVKVIHMLDPSYPVEYPADQASGGEAGLDPASSDDPRLGYYIYTTNPGFLNPSRNANLYSNYFSLRFFADSDWWPQENRVIFFTDTENDLLIAEAQLMTGNTAGAAMTLNNSTAGTGETTLGFEFPAERKGYIEDATLSGGHTMTGAETMAQFQWALLREYSVEIHTLGGVSSPWFFMRRHDLLQEGSATMLPVPASELEILGMEIYTFGGPSFAGQAGTASGANSWKNLAEKAGMTSSANLNSEKKYMAPTSVPENIRVTGSPTADVAGKGARHN